MAGAEIPWLHTYGFGKRGKSLQSFKSCDQTDETIDRFSFQEVLVLRIHRETLAPKKDIFHKDAS